MNRDKGAENLLNCLRALTTLFAADANKHTPHISLGFTSATRQKNNIFDTSHFNLAPSARHVAAEADFLAKRFADEGMNLIIAIT